MVVLGRGIMVEDGFWLEVFAQLCLRHVCVCCGDGADVRGMLSEQMVS